jgi:molybdopterin-guanine dinucleotide biosynthesis protein A
MPGWDAVVLAGGTSRRLRADPTLPDGTLPMGTDKTDLVLGGRSLLEHVLGGCLGAHRIVVVGPVRPVRAGALGEDRVLWSRESPPGSGPLAAVAAGVAATGALADGRPAPVVIVLGADMPFVGGAVPHLLGALLAAPEADAAALARDDGGPHPLALAVRRTAVTAALTRLGDPAGRPLRLLPSALRVRTLADVGHWALDVDDGAGMRAALARITTVSP